MENILTYDLYLALAPWLVFAVLSILAIILMKFAKKRRGIAIAFAVFVQMFSPDPLVEKTIAMVVSEKRAIKKQQAEDGGEKGAYKKASEKRLRKGLITKCQTPMFWHFLNKFVYKEFVEDLFNKVKISSLFFNVLISLNSCSASGYCNLK